MLGFWPCVTTPGCLSFRLPRDISGVAQVTDEAGEMGVGDSLHTPSITPHLSRPFRTPLFGAFPDPRSSALSPVSITPHSLRAQHTQLPCGSLHCQISSPREKGSSLELLRGPPLLGISWVTRNPRRGRLTWLPVSLEGRGYGGHGKPLHRQARLREASSTGGTELLLLGFTLRLL